MKQFKSYPALLFFCLLFLPFCRSYSQTSVKLFKYRCIIDSLFTGYIETKADTFKVYSIRNGKKQLYKTRMLQIREINIEWEFEIRKEFKSQAKVTFENGNATIHPEIEKELAHINSVAL